MKVQLATHTLWRKGDTLDQRTVDFFFELIGKSGHYVTVQHSGSLHTYALCRDVPTFAPDSDATRAREDEQGQAYEGTHELQAQRESAGLTYDQPED